MLLNIFYFLSKDYNLETNFFIILHQCIGQNHRSKSVLGFRMAAMFITIYYKLLFIIYSCTSEI